MLAGFMLRAISAAFWPTKAITFLIVLEEVVGEPQQRLAEHVLVRRIEVVVRCSGSACCSPSRRCSSTRSTHFAVAFFHSAPQRGVPARHRPVANRPAVALADRNGRAADGASRAAIELLACVKVVERDPERAARHERVEDLVLEETASRRRRQADSSSSCRQCLSASRGSYGVPMPDSSMQVDVVDRVARRAPTIAAGCSYSSPVETSV